MTEKAGDDVYPPRPEEPSESDCCGSGCSPCIFDVHADNLKKWQRKCEAIKNGRPGNSTVSFDKRNASLSKVRYSPFRLENIVGNARQVNVYTFQAVEITSESEVRKHDELDLKIGQHLIMKGLKDDGTNVSRAYTPISDASGRFDILVKLYTDGEMSKYFRTLSLGEICYFRGPFGDFTYAANSFKKVVLICAGTGLAPLYRIARTIVDDEMDETFVRLLFSVKTYEDIIMRDQLLAMKENWNFTAVIHVTEEKQDGRRRYGEDVVIGRITRDEIRNELGGKRDDVLVLICGTKSFNDDVSSYIDDLSDHVHVF